MISTTRHANTLAFYNNNTGGNHQNDMAAVEEDKIANECNLPKVPRLAPEEDFSYQSTKAQIAELKRVAAHSKGGSMLGGQR